MSDPTLSSECRMFFQVQFIYCDTVTDKLPRVNAVSCDIVNFLIFWIYNKTVGKLMFNDNAVIFF